MTIEELIKQQDKSPKEIANELIEMYLTLVDCGDNRYSTNIQKQNAKQCALIAIEFKLKSWFPFLAMQHENDFDSLEFWEQVKTEIENL